MASRYQKVLDPEQALQYYDACLLYREWDTGIFMPYEHINFIYNSGGHAVERVKQRVKHAAIRGRAFVLVEEDESPTNEDEEQPLG